jgi:GT2 family glycosyltransferase
MSAADPEAAKDDAGHAWPRVGIVVLNWRQIDDTLACLASLRQLDYPAYDVVVVDNGSADGSAATIRERFADIVVLENKRNLGFAAGNNVGIRHLLKSGAEYVLLLNNDTIVAPDLLKPLVEQAECDPRIGIVGPKIYYHDRANVIWSAGGTLSPTGEPGHLRVDETDDGSPETLREVDYVTGCAILIKRAVIQQIGLLDERFFIYFEEAEWCARAHRAGFRVVYVPQAHMWHKIEMGERRYSPRYTYLMSRNRLLYLRLNGAGLWTLGLAALTLLRTAAGWSLRPEHREMRGLAAAVVSGVGDFLMGRFGEPPLNL